MDARVTSFGKLNPRLIQKTPLRYYPGSKQERVLETCGILYSQGKPISHKSVTEEHAKRYPDDDFVTQAMSSLKRSNMLRQFNGTPRSRSNPVKYTINWYACTDAFCNMYKTHEESMPEPSPPVT